MCDLFSHLPFVPPGPRSIFLPSLCSLLQETEPYGLIHVLLSFWFAVGLRLWELSRGSEWGTLYRSRAVFPTSSLAGSLWPDTYPDQRPLLAVRWLVLHGFPLLDYGKALSHLVPVDLEMVTRGLY